MPATISIPTTFARARRNAATAWLERTNPLAGLSVRAAQRIYDAARGGDYSRIQYIYAELERENPVLMTCVDRRASALAGLGWKVSTTADGAEADEQKEAAERALAEAEGLDEALEHLALAFFRGFAHARPVWDGPGRLAGFDLPNNWNFARDPATGQWYWNERAEYCDPAHPGPGLTPVPPGELVTVRRTREIDRPAMALALRHAVGERDWGRFLERYGIPFVVMTAPPTADADAMGAFAASAEKIADGLSTAVPNGTSVSFAGEARGADPFTPFVEHVQKLIVLMSTGGTLTSLAESGAGTLAGGAQMEVWEQIVKRDGVAIGAALDRGVVRPLLRALFPGRAPLVRFELGGDRQLEPGEIFDLAAKARAAGYRIDKAQLEEATGYTLEEDAQAPAGGAPGGFGGGGFGLNAGTALQFGCNPLQNARSGSDGKSPVPEAGGALQRVLEAFRSDLGPAAEELQKVLALPEAEMRAACKDLADRLPDLLPADPAMAAILAEELAGAFAEAAGEVSHEDAKARSGEGLANEECRAKDPATCPVHGSPATSALSGATKPSYKPGTYDPDPKNWPMPDPKQPGRYRQANAARAQQALDMAMTTKKDVPGAAISKKLGPLDFRYGRPDSAPNKHDGFGLAHIEIDHSPEALAKVPELVAFGKYYPDREETGAYLLVNGDWVLSLKRPPTGGRYGPNSCYYDPVKAADYRRRGGQIENMEAER